MRPDEMAASSDPTLVELRGMAPRELIDVLDAISAARRQSRIELVLEVLGRWADERVHEASILQRVVRSNPQPTDSARKTHP